MSQLVNNMIIITFVSIFFSKTVKLIEYFIYGIKRAKRLLENRSGENICQHHG